MAFPRLYASRTMPPALKAIPNDKLEEKSNNHFGVRVALHIHLPIFYLRKSLELGWFGFAIIATPRINQSSTRLHLLALFALTDACQGSASSCARLSACASLLTVSVKVNERGCLSPLSIELVQAMHRPRPACCIVKGYTFEGSFKRF